VSWLEPVASKKTIFWVQVSQSPEKRGGTLEAGQKPWRGDWETVVSVVAGLL
jgi:hypothetical protein